MDYQILVNISVGIVTLLGGWVFKMILSTVNEIKSEHHGLMIKHHADIDKLREKHNDLALSLPKEYVSKEDFKMFSERMNDRFDRLEEKIDNLKWTEKKVDKKFEKPFFGKPAAPNASAMEEEWQRFLNA